MLSGDVENAICLHAFYYAIWKRFGALPERYNWQLQTPDVLFYPLRPELVESTYLLYQVGMLTSCNTLMRVPSLLSVSQWVICFFSPLTGDQKSILFARGNGYPTEPWEKCQSQVRHIFIFWGGVFPMLWCVHFELSWAVSLADVVMPLSTMSWTNPKRIAWRVSSLVRPANTFTWYVTVQAGLWYEIRYCMGFWWYSPTVVFLGF